MEVKSKRVHSFANDVLEDHDGVALAKMIKNKDISSKEVIEATINRAEQVEPAINAIVTKNFDNAIAASTETKEGFFAGLPMFFKDLTCVEGIPNFFGSPSMEGAKPSKKTDKIAQQILSMGFNNLGTSSMPEFGLTCSTEFIDREATRNPWNTERSVGGSSGGAGALVAAGVLPIAHSADGGGSTRIPASCCGLVGLKPTRDRILLSSTFDIQAVRICIDGVVTRSVRDTAHFYAEAEKYYHNKKLPKIGLVDQPLNKSLTIGYFKASEELDQATTASLEQTKTLLESLGHTLKAIDSPISEQLKDDFSILWALNGFTLKNLGKLAIKPPFDPKKLSKLTEGLSKFYTKNITKTPGALRRLKASKKTYAKHLQDNKVDIILTPTLAHLPPEIGYFAMNLSYDEIFPRMKDYACFTPLANVVGCPSISLPLGHDKATDLPIGMLFSSDFGNDSILLELAYQLELAQPWMRIQG